MNTIAWCIELRGLGGRWDVYAIHDDTALWVSEIPGTDESVYQYTPEGGQAEAIRYLLAETAGREEHGWLLRNDPVEFDLSRDARTAIWGGDPGEWVYAPLLRKELLAAVMPPKAIAIPWAPSSGASFGSWSTVANPDKPGDFYVDYAKSHSHATWDEVIG